jgi:hypothetical protein
MSGTEKHHARLAFALLCGVALCCSIMYITADAEETVLSGVEAEASVESMDVLKAGEIYSETPRGRERLMDYFDFVEEEIASEVADRKSDIADCRAQMAKDYAFNAGARAKLNRDMLHKMAVNAKIARRDLDRFMRHTQMKMARVANQQNRRNAANKKAQARTMRIMKRDAAENAKHLKLAAKQWQKATNAWAAKTNARIDKMNNHVAANAVQIKTNAKKAQKDLENAMNSWDHKVNNFKKSEKLANSKLGAQITAQSKATRAWANNKIKGLVAQTGAQFSDVETKMAKNRHDVDMALKRATMRFSSALNAQQLLNNRNYAKSVRDIQAMKADTDAKVKAMSAQFKVSLLSLQSTVAAQVSKVNARIDHASGTVRKNSAAQAKINVHVNAEMNRMIKVGNDRYTAHLKGDAELQNAIAADKAKTDDKLNKMAADFNSKLAAVKKQLKANCKHAEGRLKSHRRRLRCAVRAAGEAGQEERCHGEGDSSCGAGCYG